MPGRFVLDTEDEIKTSGRFILEPTPSEAKKTAEDVKAGVLRDFGVKGTPEIKPENDLTTEFLNTFPSAALGLGETFTRAGETVATVMSGGDTKPGTPPTQKLAGAARRTLNKQADAFNAAGTNYAQTRGGVVGAIRGGVESTIQSIGAGAAGGVAGTALGGPIGAVIGFAIGAGGVFSAAEYSSFMHDVEESARARGASDADIRELQKAFRTEGIISAAAEGGLEAASDLFAGKVLGFFGKKTVSKTAKRTLLDMVKRGATAYGKMAAAEVPSEMATSAIQTAERKKAGVTGLPSPWDAAKSAAGPTLVQTAIMGAFGAGARKVMPDTPSPDTSPTPETNRIIVDGMVVDEDTGEVIREATPEERAETERPRNVIDEIIEQRAAEREQEKGAAEQSAEVFIKKFADEKADKESFDEAIEQFRAVNQSPAGREGLRNMLLKEETLSARRARNSRIAESNKQADAKIRTRKIKQAVYNGMRNGDIEFEELPDLAEALRADGQELEADLVEDIYTRPRKENIGGNVNDGSDGRNDEKSGAQAKHIVQMNGMTIDTDTGEVIEDQPVTEKEATDAVQETAETETGVLNNSGTALVTNVTGTSSQKETKIIPGAVEKGINTVTKNAKPEIIDVVRRNGKRYKVIRHPDGKMELYRKHGGSEERHAYDMEGYRQDKERMAKTADRSSSAKRKYIYLHADKLGPVSRILLGKGIKRATGADLGELVDLWDGIRVVGHRAYDNHVHAQEDRWVDEWAQYRRDYQGQAGGEGQHELTFDDMLAEARKEIERAIYGHGQDESMNTDSTGYGKDTAEDEKLKNREADQRKEWLDMGLTNDDISTILSTEGDMHINALDLLASRGQFTEKVLNGYRQEGFNDDDIADLLAGRQPADIRHSIQQALHDGETEGIEEVRGISDQTGHGTTREVEEFFAELASQETPQEPVFTETQGRTIPADHTTALFDMRDSRTGEPIAAGESVYYLPETNETVKEATYHGMTAKVAQGELFGKSEKKPGATPKSTETPTKEKAQAPDFDTSAPIRQTGAVQTNMLDELDGQETLFSARTPRNAGITLTDVKAMFPRAKVTETEDGSFAVKIGNKKPLIIQSVQEITPDEFKFRVAYGRNRKTGEEIAGKYSDGEITISRHGDRWTLGHEGYHWLENTGMVKDNERAVIDRAAGKSIGKTVAAVTGEDRAAYVENQLMKRAEDREKGFVRRIIQKIEDFIDGLVNLAYRTARGVVRDIESGKMAERDGNESTYTAEEWRNGDVPDAVKLHMIETMEPIEVDSSELGEPNATSVFREKAKAIYHELKDVINEHDGRVIQFVMSGYKRLGHHSADKRILQIIPELKTLTEKAIPVFVEKDEHGDMNIRAWHHYAIPAKLNGADIYVRLTAKEETNKPDVLLLSLFHDAQITETAKIKEEAGPVSPLTRQELHPAFSNTKDKLIAWINSVKRENEQYSVRTKPTPKKTVKAYKLFRLKKGKIYPLYVDANTPVDIGTWYDAEEGELTVTGKVKSKLGPLAYRPGFHAGDLPIAHHIGEKRNPADAKPSFRADDQVWAEVDYAADVDWQKEANIRAKISKKTGKPIISTAAITDQVPVDGFYRYKTNPNMTGTWLIGGAMKVRRILTDAEVKQINDAAKVADLPRRSKGEQYSVKRKANETAKKELIDHTFDALGAVLDVFKKTPGKPDVGLFSEFALMTRAAEKVPALKRVVAAATMIPEYKYKYEGQIFGDDSDPESHLKTLQAYRNTNGKEYGRFAKYLFDRDRNRWGYRVTHKGNTYQLVSPVGAMMEEYTSEEEAWTSAIEHEATDIVKAGFSRDTADALVKVRLIGHNMYRMLKRSADEIMKAAYEHGDDPPQIAARGEDGKTVNIRLDVAVARMGDLRGSYMPRMRESGMYAVIATKPGTNSRLEFKLDKWSANRRKRELARKGYTARVERTKGLSEDVYAQMGGQMAVEAALKTAAERMRNHMPDIDLTDFGYGVSTQGRQLFLRGMKRDAHVEIFKSFGGNIHPSGGNMHTWVFNDVGPDTRNDMVKALLDAGEIPVESPLTFYKMIAENVADILREHGALSHRIERNKATGKDVWLGYEDTNPLKALAMAGSAIAGAAAKHNAALEMHRAILGKDISFEEYRERGNAKARYDDYMRFANDRGISPTEQKNAHAMAIEYFQDVLKNDTALERVFGIARGLATLKFLAFRVSSAAVNLTALPINAAGAISARTGVPVRNTLKHLIRAVTLYGQYKSGTLKDNEVAEIFAEIERRGWEQAQFNRELMGALRNNVGNTFDRVMDVGMWLFLNTEKINRASTIMAGYLAQKQKTVGGITEDARDAALERAKEMSDDAHSVYGKANTPMAFRGQDIGGSALRSWFTFKNFSLNYLLTMKQYFEGDRQGKFAAAWMATAGGVLGGMKLALPFAALMKLWDLAGPDDPEEWLYEWISRHLGGIAERFARFGAAGLAGVNIKGSLDTGVVDVLPDDMNGGLDSAMKFTVLDLLGAPGAVVGDAFEAGRYLSRGEILKAAEKALPTGLAAPVRAYRERTSGQTTRYNTPVFFGDETVRATNFDAVARAFGFSPSRLSRIQEIRSSEWKTEAAWKQKKERIYYRMKGYVTTPDERKDPEEWYSLLDEAKRYNEKCPDNLKITRMGIRASIRRTERPPKKELMRARTMNNGE